MDASGWDERYGKGRTWSAEPNAFFAAAVATLDTVPGRAIDLACGEGRNAIWLAEQGWTVTAVDFSSVAIDRARAAATERGTEVTWVVADLADYPLAARSWDLVAHVYLHWPSAERIPYLRSIIEAVAPGGHLLVVGHDRTNIAHGVGGPQDPDVLTTPDELATLCKETGLDVLRAEVVERDTGAEPGHGAAADAGTIALDHVVVARRT